MSEHEKRDREVRGQNTGRLLALAARCFVADLSRRLQAAGLAEHRPAHSAVIENLSDRGSRVTELAERSHMTPQAMGELVSDLERMGWVERVPDPSDRRAKLVRLTEAGWSAMATGSRVLRAIEEELVATLGADEHARLRRSLRRIVQRCGRVREEEAAELKGG